MQSVWFGLLLHISTLKEGDEYEILMTNIVSVSNVVRFVCP